MDVHDPWADPDEAMSEYGITLVQAPETGIYDGVVLAVAHALFHNGASSTARGHAKAEGVLFDLKSILPREDSDLRL